MPDFDACSRCGAHLQSLVPCVRCTFVLATTRPEPPNLEGEMFGRYVLGEVLGQGGMGIVYEAYDPNLDRKVALKMLADDVDVPDLLRREAKIAASLDHEHIAPVHDVGEHQGIAYFTMKCIDGGQLETPVPNVRRALEIALAIAEAIDFAHQRGVLHLDLKPANVLIDSSGKPFVTDFGLAIRSEPSAVASVSPAGTPHYMAPEVWRGDLDALAPAADIWGMGVLLYEMLLGRPPFQAQSIDELRELVLTKPPPPLKDIPTEIATVCLRCLEKEPGKRYATAGDLVSDLERAGRELFFRQLWASAVEFLLAFNYIGVVVVVSLLLIVRPQQGGRMPLRLEDSAMDNANRLADSLTKQMTTTFRQYALSVQNASKQRDVIDALLGRPATNPWDVCARLLQHSWSDSAWFLLDNRGKLIARAPHIKDADADRSFHFRDYYRGAENLERLGIPSAYVSRAYRSEIDDDYKVAFSITVRDETHTRVGLLVATVPTGSQSLLEAMKPLVEGVEGMQFAVIAPRDPYRADGSENSRFERVVLVQQSLARGQEAMANVDMPRDRNLFSTERGITDTPLSIVVQVSVGASSEPLPWSPTIPKL